MSAELVRVDIRYPGIWSTITGYLDSALKHGGDKDWSLMDIHKAALQGSIHLWALVFRGEVFGAVATQEIKYPRRKVLDVHLVGTDPQTETQWMNCFKQLCDIAKANGCSHIRGSGRLGWGRKLKAEPINTVEVKL